MRSFRWTSGILALALAAAAAGTGDAAAAEATLKAASFLPARSVYATYFYRWIDEVNKRCAGEVKVSAVGPEAIGSLEQWNALKTGVVDMHFGPPNYYKGTLLEAEAAILANTSSTEQRENGAWALINTLHNEKMNAWYLTQLVDGIPFFLYTNKPHVNGRFDGFRLRSVPVYDQFFRSLGAQPVRMAPPEVYTALERGTVDGYGWPLWGITDFGWQKYTKYRHGPGFYSAVVNILMNLDRWKGLAETQRKCLTDMAVWLEREWPAWREAENKKQLAQQEQAGITYVDLSPAFAQKAHDIYWESLTKASPEVIGKLRRLLVK